MDTNINLKKLWGKHENIIPEVESVINKANSYNRKSLFTIILANVSLIATLVLYVYALNKGDFQWLTTKIGMGIMMFAMLAYMFFLNGQIPLLYKVGFQMNTNQYIIRLKALKKKQLRISNIILKIYFILLSFGISLYSLEFTDRMTIKEVLIIWGITITGIALVWFVVTPKIVKQQQRKINKIIERFETIENQLSM